MQVTPLHKHFAKVAVALPIVAIAISVMLAQWNHIQGQRWKFPMQAYDPRDILRGKYLNVRFEFEVTPGDCTSNDCCVCYQDVQFDQAIPILNPVTCAQANTRCDEWLKLGALRTSYRYFIPEDKSAQLEARVNQAISDKRAQVEFVLDQYRRPQISALIIDGEPL